MAELTPEIREELKALIRESVAEELDERLRRQNLAAIEREQVIFSAYMQSRSL